MGGDVIDHFLGSFPDEQKMISLEILQKEVVQLLQILHVNVG